ncbi:AAA family ATPase [Bacillus sp. 166amftsu]|uniref:ATP-dependent nuclease n=1 Tax=Bacillus sp. 166amftsu TaxID=1761753 RepID=UPI0008983257|nr:AAA family ATPase [Bacillus sp. 166amftsu]SDZ00067.1 Predicted ATP-dependent endonuclease of the OLD family, contains P-loop ATPase and TOPRIM domains [Bacillus sp. 166amftsu]
MKLSKLKLKNFKCFGLEEEKIEFDNLTTIIGANSAGKTAIMHALLKLFGDTGNEKEVTRADFHIPVDKSPDEVLKNYLSIEAVFEFPELQKNNGAESYAVPIYYENFVVSSPGNPPFMRVLLEATWQQSSSPEGIIESKYFFITAKEDEEVTEINKKPMSKYDRSHIKVIYVPAVREPSSQLKNASGTLLWRTLKGINWSDADKQGVQQQISLVDQKFGEQPGVSLIQKTIEGQWKNYHNEERYKNASLKFNSTDLENILKKVEVEFTPTEIERAYKIDSLGDGLRSLFYLSLVDSLLEIENQAIKEIFDKQKKTDERIFNIEPPALTLIAIEEPENHIGPQLLGRVINNLERIAGRENSQTILTSHNPSIVKRIDPRNIRHVRLCRKTSKTLINKIALPSDKTAEFKYVKEAVRAYPEIYFASLVILGEGDSEEIILPKVMELSGSDLDSNGISVVPLGGRHVNHFWRLLSQLDIPYITLLDLDRERHGGGWGRIQYVLNQLIEIGFEKEKLLELEDGSVLSDRKFKSMHELSLEEDGVSLLNSWVEYLETHNVFFSNPLDIDFLMLETFKDFYMETISGQEGPFIKDLGKIKDLSNKQKSESRYKDRVLEDIRKTLKPEGGDGSTYSDDQKELMIWYNYFFLSRGKPSTHILATSKIKPEIFSDKLPEIFKKILKASRNILGQFNDEIGVEDNEIS